MNCDQRSQCIHKAMSEMSLIQTSSEPRIPNNDEQTTEDSDAFRQVDNAKLGKFASFSDTTLQDIPTEILQVILVKAIIMEVRNMKLAKFVWKEKADLVISRLGSVCSQWNNVLTTDFFRMELHRALDGIAEQRIRMEIVQESLIDNCVTLGIAALKDDIFLLCRKFNDDNAISSLHYIKVYDRKNMAEVKDVIELPGPRGEEIASCNVSNCIYVLAMIESHCDSLIRITKDEDQKFNVHSWISDLRWPANTISVSDEGRVILSSTQDEQGSRVVSVYDPNGLLHHEVTLSRDVGLWKYVNNCMIRKSNGNFVLSSPCDLFQMVLTEIDTNGIVQRKYRQSLEPMSDVSNVSFMSFADASGRILIHNNGKGLELLDSELNHLEFIGSLSYYDDYIIPHSLHFNNERNELMGICSVVDSYSSFLKIFRFIEV